MTTALPAPPASPGSGALTASGKQPRQLDPGHERSDRYFFAGARAIGLSVLVVTGAIAVFLGYQGIPTLHHYGLHFLTTTQWDPEIDKIGIAAVLVGTIEVALVAMAVAFPLAVMFALFITDYAPRRLKSWLISAIDLMAAVPSIIYGLWGFFLLQPHAINLSRWLSQHFGWFPLFHVDTDPNAAVWQQSRYTSSAFIAGLAVSMMAIPLACAVIRAVFDQAPAGEREAAMALGATRWGVARKVVLPFGKGGIIGGSMLALGRALGETAAVLIIISPAYEIKPRILEAGTQTTSALIAGNFGSATKAQLTALLAAGFVLFLMTLAVNTVAATIIARSRSGAGTDI
ncbi:MAG TPA: phosphate ABC transporter permease subunit PstC [Mycobacteriales bacterium]|nr:phosphate ABC transporter permease subunit PstC [Mycobacteriales bacterium]